MTIAQRLLWIWRRSGAARREALATIQQVPTGQWVARIGGRVRGRMETFTTRHDAERAVNAHYNQALLAALKKELHEEDEEAPGAGEAAR